jgi:hypothetical protein
MIFKLNETKAKTKTSGAFYALANNDDPDIYGEDFYCWDTDYDSGYGLGPIQSAKRSRDVFKTLEAAEERARDIIDSVGVSEVFIVEVEDEYSYNLTDFVKRISTDSETIEESKQIVEAINKVKVTGGACGTKWIYDTMQDGFDISVSVNDVPCRFRFAPYFGRNAVNGLDCNEVFFAGDNYPSTVTKAGGSHRTYALYIPEDVLKSAPKQNQKDFSFTGQYYSVTPVIKYFKNMLKTMLIEHPEYFTDKFLASVGMSTVDTIKVGESEFIKETTSVVPDYVQRTYVAVDYICDGTTNFRVLGGGFNTDNALVGVEDSKGKRLRLSMDDVCDFFTWYDAKGNIIREPEWDNIEVDDDNEFEVPWGGTEERETPWSKY